MRRWRNTIATLVVLVPVIAVVVYTSLHVDRFECEVCMVYDGRRNCRTVTGQTQEEGMRSAVDNACALLASGVTDTLRCTRSQPEKASCRELGG